MKITDVFYAAIGAPVLAGRKLYDIGGKAVTLVRDSVAASAEEGRAVADKMGEGNVVEELSTRLEVDERVGKLRDQVESVIDRWREGFHADKDEKKAPAAKKAPAKKATAKKAPAKKAEETAKKAPAKKAEETAGKAEDKAEKVEVTA
jgi:hypothetical protein